MNARSAERDYDLVRAELAAQAPEVVPGRHLEIISAQELVKMDLPPRTNVIAPWLPAQGLALISGDRGTGKTYLGLSIAHALCSGGPLFSWSTPEPKNVLYIDGEMAATTLRERILKIAQGAEKDAVGRFEVLTPDNQPKDQPPFNLDRETDQALLDRYLDGVDVIIVDNISTLSGAASENDKDGWYRMQGWALQMRKQGRCVIFIHHTNRRGGQRGFSGREDVMDTCALLSNPRDYSYEEGCRFEFRFTKARGFYGDDAVDFVASLEETPNGGITWSTQTLKESNRDFVARLLQEGLSNKDIAEETGLSKGYVSKVVHKLKC